MIALQAAARRDRSARHARLATVTAWAFVALGCAPETPPSRPNVLLISIDSLRADHLGCYGYSRPTSPATDRLAAEGTLFEVATSSSSWTLPAHAALFTGLPDSIHGAYSSSRPLVPERRTLAEALRAEGYITAGIWSGPPLHPSLGVGQGFEAWVSHRQVASSPLQGLENWELADVRSFQDVTSPRILKWASSWLDAWSRSPDRRPFFLFLHMWDPHFDYIPPPPYDRMFDPDYSGIEDGRGLSEYHLLRSGDLSARDLEHLRALYDGEIAWTDFHVGELLQRLEELGIAGGTMVVLTADHGEEFFEHGLFGHQRQLFEESVRIPLIVRWPGRVPAGIRRTEPVRIVDVAPTLLELAGARSLTDILGVSLVPALEGRSVGPGAPAISELLQDETTGDSLLAVRGSGWRLLARPNEGKVIGLWDLGDDPGEQRNVYEVAPDLTTTALDSMRRTLADLERLRSRHAANAADFELSEPLRRELESLGYLGISSARSQATTSDPGNRR